VVPELTSPSSDGFPPIKDRGPAYGLQQLKEPVTPPRSWRKMLSCCHV